MATFADIMTKPAVRHQFACRLGAVGITVGALALSMVTLLAIR